MRIAIISDIHGNKAGFDVVLKDMKSRRIDRVISLGDLVDGGDENEEVVKFMQLNNILNLRGNHDENNSCKLSSSLQDWLNECPEFVYENDIIFTHISPRPKQKSIKNSIEAWNVFDEVNFKLCFVGHLHFPVLFSEENQGIADAYSHSVDEGCHVLDLSDRYIISFGAIGYPRGGGKFLRYGIFDQNENTVEFIKLVGPLLPFGLAVFD